MLHLPIHPREKQAVLRLRALGYRMQDLAAVTGRSLSQIYKIIHKAEEANAIPHVDQRKLPTRTKRINSHRRLFSLWKWFILWSAWILSDSGDPP